MLPAQLKELLKQNSRTFYWTLRVLPRAVRLQIGLAYLLARTTDTIADTELVPLEQRLAKLQKLRERILGTSDAPLNFGELARQQGSPAERVLLEKVEDSLSVLRALTPTDLKRVRQVLDTITGGQELDLRRSAGASSEKIIALQTDAELDDYTYRVAGCVGGFWTEMCVAHVFHLVVLDGSWLPATFQGLGVRFGKGLQLVNILRDLPRDLRKGRCYLPADALAEIGLKPTDLVSPANEAKFRPLYNRYIDLAESHLAAGWEYTNLIPFNHLSLRLACAWPVLIGVRTLARLRVENPLDPAHPIKIRRAEVRGLIWRSLLLYPWRSAWRNQAPLPADFAGKAVASDANLS